MLQEGPASSTGSPSGSPLMRLRGEGVSGALEETTFSDNNSNSMSNGIGNLEHVVHREFANVRVPGEDFVYSPSYDLLTALDNHCDEKIEHDKPSYPLLVVGEAGSGKSALLSNWILRRKRGTKRHNNSDQHLEEFIFWHAIGSSRSSMDVNSLMRRLIEELKTRFQLSKEMPETQEKLSWELPRFFEMAARRGRIIIVIDGLHRLMNGDEISFNSSDEGSKKFQEAGLSWLPYELPGRVKVILSITSHPAINLNPNEVKISISKELNGDSSESPAATRPNTSADSRAASANMVVEDNAATSSRPHRILLEVERRIHKWHVIHLKPLELSLCKGVIESFIQKCVKSGESSENGQGKSLFLTEVENNSDEISSSESNNLDDAFLLHASQVSAVLGHPLGGSPIFLRLFLRCTFHAVMSGFSIWSFWDEWLKATSVSELIEKILTCFEEGFRPSREATEFSIDRTIMEGGYPSLRFHYSWHPAVQRDYNAKVLGLDEVGILPFSNQGDTVVKARGEDEMNANGESKKNSDGSPIPASRGAVNGSGLDGGKKSFSASVYESLGDQQWIMASQEATRKLQRVRNRVANSLEDFIISCDGQSISETVDKVVASINQAKELDLGHKNLMAGIVKVKDDKQTRRAITRRLSKIDSIRSFDDVHDEYSKAQSTKDGQWGDIISDIRSPVSTPLSNEKISKSERKWPQGLVLDPSAYEASSAPKDATPHTNPSDDLARLPLYMRGGRHAVGLAEYLGNSLALLYVARHGLKLEELWQLLSELSLSSKQRSAGGLGLGDTKDPSYDLLMLCYEARGFLEDSFRVQDIFQSGKISLHQMQVAMMKAHNSLRKSDALRLLEIIEIFDTSINAEGSLFESSDETKNNLGVMKNIERLEIDYATVIDRILSKVHFIQKSKTKAKLKGKDGSPRKKLPAIPKYIKDSLLFVLRDLGVLYSRENSVVLFPLDSYEFRGVVLHRYVMRPNQGVDYWHGILVKFFHSQANSMRRCEELPWHLQICRKWYALKDALLDIRTFNMMYALRGDGDDALKGEYMSYWVTLTEGPLYVSDDAQNSASTHKARNPMLKNKTLKILADIDTAVALNLSEKDSKKRLLKEQVAPFDIVEEFNKSLENMVFAEKPNATQLKVTILNIAKFLASFSTFKKETPYFSRMGLDMSAMQSFGVLVEEIKDVDPAAAALVQKQNEKVVKSTKDMVMFPTALQCQSQYYYYLRWMWVQFPWLALETCTAYGSDGTFSTNKEGSGDGMDVDFIEGDNAKTKETANAAKMDASDRGRYWEVKKNDPTVVVLHQIESRRHATIKARMLSSKSNDALNGAIKHIKDEIVSSGKPTQKFRRSFEEELEVSSKIPHSEHCKRSLRLGSLFPSLEEHIKNNNDKLQEDLDVFEKAAASMRRGGQGVDFILSVDDEIMRLKQQEDMATWNQNSGNTLPIGTKQELDLGRELNRMGKLRALSDRVNALYRERRALCDELALQVHNRNEQDEEVTANFISAELAISSLEQRWISIASAIAKVKKFSSSYKALIELMDKCPPSNTAHLDSIQQNLLLAKQQLQDLKGFRMSLYMDAEHMQDVQKKQFKTKIDYYRIARKNLAIKRDKILNEHPFKKSSPKTSRRRINTNESVDSDNISVISEESSKPVISDALKSMIANSFSHAAQVTRLTENEKEKEEQKQEPVITTRRADPESDVVEAKSPEMINQRAREMQSKMVFEFLVERTGYNNEKDFVDRYRDAQKLTETLQNSQLVADNQLQQLQREHAVLFQTWTDIAYVDASTAGASNEDTETAGKEVRDTRYLDRQLFSTEMKVLQLQRQIEKAFQTMSEVRTGVTFLASLLHNNTKLLHNLPKSSPPVIKNEGDIIAALSWAEERIQGINEMIALEGNNKAPANDDSRKTFFERQIDLAVTMQETIIKQREKSNNKKHSVLTAIKKHKKEKGRLTKDIIDPMSHGSDAFLSSEEVVVVKTLEGVEEDYLLQNKKLYKEIDQRNEAFDQQRAQQQAREAGLNMDSSKFINQALATKESSLMLRKANAMGGVKVGSRKTYGPALEDILKKKTPQVPAALSTKK